MMGIFYDTYFVVALSFVLFVALVWYYGAFRIPLRALDDRADRIRRELDDAKRLREEAQGLLANYERRQRDVEEQAGAIVARAREDAQIAAEEAKKSLADSVKRRLKAAEEQIAAAEASAIREVKDRAVAIATQAAAEVIARGMTADAADRRIDASIEEVGRRLH